MVDNIFKCAKTHPPCIVFFDEVLLFYFVSILSIMVLFLMVILNCSPNFDPKVTF